MVKLWMVGVVTAAACGPALAGTHYVEVWNPPEARTGAVHPKPALKPPRHRRVGVTLAQAAKLRHRPGGSAAGNPKVATGTLNTPNSQPSFDDLPRQITPEGNVLRVDGRDALAHVER
jgi:hypothetical protein